MMTYFVIHENGDRYGPADEATLAQWVAEGRVGPDTQLEETSSGRRVPAHSVPSLGFRTMPGQSFRDWSQAPGAESQSTYPRYNQPPGGDGSKEATLAWIFGSLGLICCPYVFSVCGIVLGYQSKKKGSRSGAAAMVFSIATLVVSIAVGIFFNPFASFLSGQF